MVGSVGSEKVGLSWSGCGGWKEEGVWDVEAEGRRMSPCFAIVVGGNRGECEEKVLCCGRVLGGVGER
jgi:hypothetical protein